MASFSPKVIVHDYDTTVYVDDFKSPTNSVPVGDAVAIVNSQLNRKTRSRSQSERLGDIKDLTSIKNTLEGQAKDVLQSISMGQLLAEEVKLKDQRLQLLEQELNERNEELVEYQHELKQTKAELLRVKQHAHFLENTISNQVSNVTSSPTHPPGQFRIGSPNPKTHDDELDMSFTDHLIIQQLEDEKRKVRELEDALGVAQEANQQSAELLTLQDEELTSLKERCQGMEIQIENLTQRYLNEIQSIEQSWRKWLEDNRQLWKRDQDNLLSNMKTNDQQKMSNLINEYSEFKTQMIIKHKEDTARERNLQEELYEQLQRIAKLERELGECYRQNESLKWSESQRASENAQLNEKLHALQENNKMILQRSEFSSPQHKEMEELRHSLKIAEQEISVMREKLDQKEVNYDAVRRLQEEYTLLSIECSSLKSELARSKENNENEISRLQSHLDQERRLHLDDVTRLEQQISYQLRNSLQRDGNVEKTVEELMIALQEEHFHMQEMHLHYNKQMQYWSIQALQDVESRERHSISLSEEVARLQRILFWQHEENTDLRLRLREIQVDFQYHESHHLIRKRDIPMRQMVHERNADQQIIDDLHRQLRLSSREIERLLEEMDRQQREKDIIYHTVMEDKERARQSVVQAMALATSQERQLQECVVAIKQLREENTKLEALLLQQVSVNDERTKCLQVLQEQWKAQAPNAEIVVRLTQAAEDLRREKQILEHELSESRQEIQKLEQSIDHLRSHYDEQIKQSKWDYDSTKARLTETEKLVKELQRSESEAHSLISGLERQLISATEEEKSRLHQHESEKTRIRDVSEESLQSLRWQLRQQEMEHKNVLTALEATVKSLERQLHEEKSYQPRVSPRIEEQYHRTMDEKVKLELTLSQMKANYEQEISQLRYQLDHQQHRQISPQKVVEELFVHVRRVCHSLNNDITNENDPQQLIQQLSSGVSRLKAQNESLSQQSHEDRSTIGKLTNALLEEKSVVSKLHTKVSELEQKLEDHKEHELQWRLEREKLTEAIIASTSTSNTATQEATALRRKLESIVPRVEEPSITYIRDAGYLSPKIQDVQGGKRLDFNSTIISSYPTTTTYVTDSFEYRCIGCGGSILDREACFLFGGGRWHTMCYGKARANRSVEHDSGI